MSPRGHGKRRKKITAPTRSSVMYSGCAPEYMTLCAALSTNKGVGRRGHTSRVARSVGEFGTLFKNTEDAPEPARLNARHGKDLRAARNEISREASLPLLVDKWLTDRNLTISDERPKRREAVMSIDF